MNLFAVKIVATCPPSKLKFLNTQKTWLFVRANDQDEAVQKCCEWAGISVVNRNKLIILVELVSGERKGVVFSM